MRHWNNGRVPLPPMPTDPSVCRWCDGHVEHGHCEANCLPADTKDHLLYELRCGECDRKHRTGRVSHSEPCWECVRKERALYQAQADAGGKKLTRYTTDRVRLGMASRGGL
jgi:hypothetical protein